MKQLSCDQCRECWDELINKSTFEADPQFADVRAHLESCAECRKIFDSLVAARQELQQLPAQKAPVSLRANILNQIENSQQQNASWWSSLFVSSQRLVWASGAIMAVFVIALLMRPEHKTPIMQTAPKVLSNRGQVEEHNNAQSEVPVAPSLVKKGKTLNPRQKAIAKSSTPKQPSAESGSVNKSKPHQMQIAPAPKSASESDQKSSEQLKSQPQQKSEPQKSAVRQAQRFAPPAPINNDAVGDGQPAKDAAGAARSSENFTIQSNAANRAMAQGVNGPEGRAGATAVFKSQSMSQIIHWSKIITSDYDVANAKITVTPEEGLTFADESSNNSERTLWRGTLFRGKQIPLNIDLRRTSNEAGKLHLKMMDADTQKVLLDKTFDVK